MRSRHFFFAVMSLSMLAPVSAYDWSTNPGDGSAENPYQISTPEHLVAVNDLDTDGKHFCLMNNIDLDPNLPGNRVFEAVVIGNMHGTFDGAGFSVRNLTIQNLTQEYFYAGLFGVIGDNGRVQNLNVENVSMIAFRAYYMGALAGENTGVIINCHSSGCLQEGLVVGGLVSRNGNWNSSKALIASSSSSCTIASGSFESIGGLAAYNVGSIFQCAYSGQITAFDSSVGGVIGTNMGVVNQCFSDAEITGERAGGLVCSNSGIIENSYALGTLMPEFDSGGLVGENYCYQVNRFARIENCYAAVVTESAGLIGWNWEQAAELSSFWDTDVSGTTFSCGGKGLTTGKMKDPNTFINAGWDLAGESTNGSYDIWHIDPNSNNGYPSLVFKPIDGGDGSPEKPYVIYTKQHLLNFFNTPALWDKHILMIANIDLSDAVFTSPPIGTFSGVFDGCHCTISGLTVNSVSEGGLGLIEVIGRSGHVRNLHIENASMTAENGGILAMSNLGQIADCHVQGTIEGMECGGLVCVNEGIISRCSADCSVDAWHTAGGLVGLNIYGGIVEESCSFGSIATSLYGGGLVGLNWSKIQHSYSMGEVAGSGPAGSLVGSNELGIIICCYATGTVQNNRLVGFNGGVVAHSPYRDIDCDPAWEGNSWYEEDGHIWTQDPSTCYRPMLKWQQWGEPITAQTCGYTPSYRMDPQRDGSEERPYIFSPELADFPADWDKHFIMTEDLDVQGGPEDALIPCFNGTLDGGGHVIRNLFLENQHDLSPLGFFGMLGHDAHIKQLGIEGQVDYFSRFPALFAGINFGTLEECFARGSVTCPTYGALLTGFNGGTIRSCYAEGTLTLTESNPNQTPESVMVGGGLYAQSWGRVLNSYSSVEAVYPTDYIYSGVGGLNEGLVWNSYWNKSLADPNFILGGKPLTDIQMKDPNSFAGWGDNIWKIATGVDMPRLAWENTDWRPESGIPPEEWPHYVPIVDVPRSYAGGNGKAQSPYLLTTAEHLFTLGKHLSDCDKYFALDSDIDLSGQMLSESVIGYFSGNFNGSGHRISGLQIISRQCIHCEDPTYLGHHISISGIGLFGCIDAGGIVENLAVEDVNIDGMCTVGSLAGENNGTIRRSYATGEIHAIGNVGGLVGVNGFERKDSSAIIENCYTNANVTRDAFEFYADRYLGGIAGTNGGTVRNCYSAGSLEVNDFTYGHHPFVIGGTAGSSTGDVENCFYLCDYTTYSCGQELDVQHIKQQGSFTGWDFLGESANGQNEIWRMCADGVDYPRLSWEFAQDGDFACADGVDLADLLALAERWLMTETNNPTDFSYAADANGDTKVNLADLAVLSDNWP